MCKVENRLQKPTLIYECHRTLSRTEKYTKNARARESLFRPTSQQRGPLTVFATLVLYLSAGDWDQGSWQS